MNLKDVKADVWFRLAVLSLALVNQFLTTAGVNPIAISDDQLYQTLTGVFTIATALVAFWKNNSFTASAQRSDAVMQNLKSAAVKTIMDKSEKMLDINKPTEVVVPVAFDAIEDPVVVVPVETIVEPVIPIV